MKPQKIYIAGPYTKGDVADNVRVAVFQGNYAALLGHYPFIPHLSHFWHFLQPHGYEFWIGQDMAWLELCDAILTIPGESSGADKEVERAKELGLIIYKSVFDIPKVDE